MQTKVISETLANVIKLSTQPRRKERTKREEAPSQGGKERTKRERGPKRTPSSSHKSKTQPIVGHKGANEQLGFHSPHQWQGYMKKKGMGNLKKTSLAITTCLKIEVA
jgi:hypothetical protein